VDRVLILRLAAPTMSFGGPLVDAIGSTTDRPHRSMLTGILANALGYDHADSKQTERLQERVRFATRQDRAGELLRDYQTIDFNQQHLPVGGWTTRGVVEERKNADKKTGTHIRERFYLADAEYVVALKLVPSDEAPTLDELALALRRPARTLFIGRACNLPSRPLFDSIVEASSLHAALETVPFIERESSSASVTAGRLDAAFGADLSEPESTTADERKSLRAWWSPGEGPDQSVITHAITDERDWHNQIVVGRRMIYEGTVRAPIARPAKQTRVDESGTRREVRS
jgi:CRISPR system Cascade subunit CasD